MSAQIALETSDKETFKVDKEVAERSVMLKNMLEDVGDSPEMAIPLPNVTANVLKKVRSLLPLPRALRARARARFARAR